jgi:hypothetical protein
MEASRCARHYLEDERVGKEEVSWITVRVDIEFWNEISFSMGGFNTPSWTYRVSGEYFGHFMYLYICVLF